MSDDQGLVYAAFIRAELEGEQSRRSSLEDRAWKLQQSCGVVLGLFATACGLTLPEGERLAGGALATFATSCVTLILAFALTFAVSHPRWYDVADVPTLSEMLESHWGDGAIASRNVTAHINLRTIATLRDTNAQRARWIIRAAACEGAGIIAAGITLALVAI